MKEKPVKHQHRLIPFLTFSFVLLLSRFMFKISTYNLHGIMGCFKQNLLGNMLLGQDSLLPIIF